MIELKEGIYMDTPIRDLTYGQILEIRTEGLDPSFETGDEVKMMNVGLDLADHILDSVYGDLDLDEEDYDECLILATNTYKKAFEEPSQELLKTVPKPRKLKRKEMRKLQEAGLDLRKHNHNELTAEISSAMIDHILKNIYSDTDFTDVPYSVCLYLGKETYQSSYGQGKKQGDEIKNS